MWSELTRCLSSSRYLKIEASGICGHIIEDVESGQTMLTLLHQETGDVSRAYAQIGHSTVDRITTTIEVILRAKTNGTPNDMDS